MGGSVAMAVPSPCAGVACFANDGSGAKGLVCFGEGASFRRVLALLVGTREGACRCRLRNKFRSISYDATSSVPFTNELVPFVVDWWSFWVEVAQTLLNKGDGLLRTLVHQASHQSLKMCFDIDDGKTVSRRTNTSNSCGILCLAT
jgi:hypothetical protein